MTPAEIAAAARRVITRPVEPHVSYGMHTTNGCPGCVIADETREAELICARVALEAATAESMAHVCPCGKVEDASRWFGADQDGNVKDDAELAEAIEADSLTTDFVAAARGWAKAIAEAEARTWQAAADLAAEVSLCDRNGTVYAAAPMRLSIVRVLRAQAAKARAKEPDND